MNSGAGLRVLLVWCLAGLALAGWWFARQDQDASDRVRATYPLGDSIPLDRLTEVRITHADGRTFEMISTPAGWQQTAPFPVGIDTYSLRQLGSAAQGLVRVDSIDITEPEAAARLGLDPAAATITWRWREDDEIVSKTVELGNRTLAGRAWVRLDDDPGRAALVDADLHVKVLETDMRYLRNRMLAPDAGPETFFRQQEAKRRRGSCLLVSYRPLAPFLWLGHQRAVQRRAAVSAAAAHTSNISARSLSQPLDEFLW